MDVTPFLDLKIAPRAVFDQLAERRARPRFFLPEGNDWRAVTWGAFADQIKHAALFLGAAGLRSGDRAAIFAANRVEWASAALAIQAAGGVMVPIYPSNTAEQAAYVVEHSDTKVLFVDGAALLARIFEAWGRYDHVERIVLLDDSLDAAKVLAKVAAAGKDVPPYADVERVVVPWSRVMTIGEARDREEPGAFEATMNGVSLDQPGVMLYTSGTSGNPKGVPLTHKNIAINGLDWLKCNAPLLGENMVDLLWLPMSHIFGFGEVCLGNALGFTSYLTDPRAVVDRLPEVRPHVFMSVPSVWEKLAMTAMHAPTPDARRAKLAEITGGNLKFCLSGGAGLKREVKDFFHACGYLIIEGYGLTETSPTLTLNRPDAFRFDSVGKPLPSVELRLAEDGEILARGPTVFGGYHKDPAATAEAFTEDGWFKTGDVGRFTDDGFLQIIDRKKDILVTAGGKNVPPANIEQRFADDPFIAHVVVYGDGKKYLVAGVWLNDEAMRAQLDGVAPDALAPAKKALVQQRIDRVNATLASYESIKSFVVMERPLTVDGGLLTPTLKVRRKKVYEAFREELESLYAPLPNLGITASA
ncbi:MAG: long-chain fatty acid--CoA ligase [Deltaproteobacteria bacterium]|nr:long-chain fatty acid--CoA ligase [Deltaproteobacteria bacterium]